LPHVFVGAREQGAGFADDYLLLASALLDVFELTSDPEWLTEAVRLMEEVERTFADKANGGYFLTASEHERLLFRDKPDYDGPIPSANSVAALAWLRLCAITDDERYRERAETTLRAFSRSLASRPLALDHMLLALDWATDVVKEIVIVVPEGHGSLTASARGLLTALNQSFAPNSVLLVASEPDLDGEIGKAVPWAQGKKLRSGRATAYVCERGACKLPTNDPESFARELAEARPYGP
jgi:uncharacterized protein YyaL (SSP411 family)